LYDESLGIVKKFPIRERASLEFRAEFYNFLNRVVFAPPTTNINSTSFGRVSALWNNPRQGQLGLRLNW
jgi:hypothetical protein